MDTILNLEELIKLFVEGATIQVRVLVQHISGFGYESQRLIDIGEVGEITSIKEDKTCLGDYLRQTNPERAECIDWSKYEYRVRFKDNLEVLYANNLLWDPGYSRDAEDVRKIEEYFTLERISWKTSSTQLELFSKESGPEEI